MEKIAGELKIPVVDKQAIPPAAADVSGAASRIIASGANYVTSWAPVARPCRCWARFVGRAGTARSFIITAATPGSLAQLKDPKLVMSPEYSFTVEKLPVFTEIEAAAKKYGVSLPIDTLSLGWASGMVLEEALKKCARPARARS